MNFNHVICCVPLKNDTLWLECTDPYGIVGYQGSFTGNRKALIISDTLGKFINTKHYTSSDNITARKVVVYITKEGQMNGKLDVFSTGISSEAYFNIYNTMDKEGQKKELTEIINIPSFEIENFEFHEVKEALPKMNVTATLSINKFGSRSDHRISFRPNLISDFIYIPLNEMPRKNPFYLNPNIYNKQIIDTFIYHLPLDYDIEQLPSEQAYKTDFGNYVVTFTQTKNQLICARSLEFKAGTYPAERFTDFVNFLKGIKATEKGMVVIKTKD